MNSDSAVRSAVGFFLVILAAALVSAVLGGAFATLIAVVSPEFCADLFFHKDVDTIIRYALAVGMIWGLFIGAAVGAFASLLAAIIKILKIRFDYKNGQASDS